MSTKKKIIELLEGNSLVFSNTDKLFSFLSSALEMEESQVKKIFYSLVSAGEIFELRKNKFITVPSHGTAKGFGFVKVDGFKEDVFIPANKTNGALDGEFVIVKLLSQNHDECDGEVVSIYKELENIVGTVEVVNKNLFLNPDNNKISIDIPIVKTGLKIEKNMKVMAKILRTDAGKVKCCVSEILGFQDDVKALELSIIRDHNLFENFPQQVVEAEKKVPKQVAVSQKKGRLDLTKETIFTIDGADAKDLDDAVHIKKFDKYYPSLGW